MEQREIYARSITRDVNPAVSATDFQADTVKIEIDEYVFTDEIINGLFRILTSIRNGNVNHNGIWVNGYFGSGKSHFMKYLGYCLDKQYQNQALDRLLRAVQENDPLSDKPKFSIETTIAESQDLSNWLKQSEIEIVMLNLGSAYNPNTQDKAVFTEILWNQFNAHRGMNSFNLALAQYLEKPLIEKGLFDQFKQEISSKGFNWKNDAAELANMELDMILDIYRHIIPTITIESVKEAILANNMDISPANFCAELGKYIQTKSQNNYRLVFMLDEVSLFIDNRRWLLLQLQEIVTGLHNDCGDKVWLMCTAQQALNEVIDNVRGIHNDFGQIMGRFEVRVSLQGTQTEYITQQRLLSKNEAGIGALNALYERKKSALESQFILPSSYSAYTDKVNFIDFYPFVPYQFRLIMQVFNSFVAHNYVDVQVKGNERSILKVTHTTAKNACGEDVGKLIAFDRFYNAMFEDALTKMGQDAIKNANEMIKTYTGNIAFGKRVVNLLFMLCNLSQGDQMLFPATLDNILTLMLEDVDAQKASLRKEIKEVLDFLCSNHILRIEKINNMEVYQFQSEDEIEVAQLIENKQVDNSDVAEQINSIINLVYGTLNNKEPYATRNFSVCLNINGRLFLQSNNPDITVDVVFESDTDNLQEYALHNDQSHMILFLAPMFKSDLKLRQTFNWYCKVQKFMQDPTNSAEREKTRRLFAENAKKRYDDEIIPAFRKMLNGCEIASGNTLIQLAELIGKQNSARYKEAVKIHLRNIYTNALQVVGDQFPRTTDDLKRKIMRPIQPGEYGELDSMSNAEKAVDTLLHRKSGIAAIVVGDIVKDLAKKPYGWSELCSLYILNELVRRNIWAFKYMNQSTTVPTIANKIVSESQKFTIVPADQIPSDVINSFVSAWNEVFNNASQFSSTYDVNQLLRECRDDEQSKLHILVKNYTADYTALKDYSFAEPLKQALDMFQQLLQEKETLPFLQMFIDKKDKNKALLDKCKRIREFRDQQLTTYNKICQFAMNNQDNFDFLNSEEDNTTISNLKAILTDVNPMDNMPQYIKWYNNINNKIQGLIESKRNEVKKAYQTVFTHLHALETQYQVSILPDEDATTISKTQSTNLYALDAAVNTAEKFKEEWEHKLSYDITQRGNGGTQMPPQVITQIIHTHSLTTLHPLCSEAEIDEYLKTLREKLIASLHKSGQNGKIEIKD